MPSARLGDGASAIAIGIVDAFDFDARGSEGERMKHA